MAESQRKFANALSKLVMGAFPERLGLPLKFANLVEADRLFGHESALEAGDVVGQQFRRRHRFKGSQHRALTVRGAVLRVIPKAKFPSNQ